MRNYAIVGGAGFIGSHLVEALCTNRPDLGRVLVLDNFSSGSPDRLASVANDSRVVIEEVDVGSSPKLPDLLRNCDHVFHLAANPDISAAVEKPAIDFWNGTYLAHRVIDACREAGVRDFTFTSGSGVYGDISSSEPLREDRGALAPISTYGASKLGCEALLSSYTYMFDLRAVAFRFANVVGPRQTHGVTFDFVRKLFRNERELEILGDGTQLKSYLHVKDAVSAMLLLDREDRPTFDIFNAATLDTLDVMTIARLVVKEMKLDRVKFNFTGGSRGWPGDVPMVSLDSSKLRALGWHTDFDSRSAIIDSVRANIAEASVS